MRIVITLACLCVAVTLVPFGADADGPATTNPATRIDTVYRRMTAADLGGILKAMNIPYEVKTDSHGDPLLRFKLAGFPAQMLVYGRPGAEKSYTSLQLHAAFKCGKRRAEVLERVNAWNRKKRFSKAYADSNQDFGLEADLDLSGGVTADTVKAFINTFKLSMISWVIESGED